MLITGRFKDARNPDFRMTLTSNVSNADFQQGYCVTGTLDRGCYRMQAIILHWKHHVNYQILQTEYPYYRSKSLALLNHKMIKQLGLSLCKAEDNNMSQNI
jgi:hypothetical protein